MSVLLFPLSIDLIAFVAPPVLSEPFINIIPYSLPVPPGP